MKYNTPEEKILPTERLINEQQCVHGIYSVAHTWGTEQYPGRPSLTQLLESQIVAVWVDDPLIDSRRRQGKDRFMLVFTQQPTNFTPSWLVLS